MDEHFEQALLVRKNAPGVLVGLSAGTPGRGLGVTIHGINASAVDVAPLTRELVLSGAATLTFVYDDNYRRLGHSAADLAAALRPLIEARPAEPLRIGAHSMGARVALAAIARLASESVLGERRVELDLVAPALAGFAGANFTRMDPALTRWLKNTQPALDLGTTSDFQRRLESLALPAHIRVRVFLASQDHVIDSRHPRLWRMLNGLRAEVVPLADTTHATAVVGAADWLAQRRCDAAGPAESVTSSTAGPRSDARVRRWLSGAHWQIFRCLIDLPMKATRGLLGREEARKAGRTHGMDAAR